MLNLCRIFLAATCSLAIGFSATATALPEQASSVPSNPNDLTAQDIDYLSMLHSLLLTNKEYDYRIAVKELPHQSKIRVAKEACQFLRNGATFQELGKELYATDVSDVVPPGEEDMFKNYMLTAWMLGVEYYCPEYTYQVEQVTQPAN